MAKNAVVKGNSSSEVRCRPFSGDIDLAGDTERASTASPSRPDTPASYKALLSARTFLGGPGDVVASSAALKVLEEALKRSLPPAANRG